MSDFHALLLEGVFFAGEDDLVHVRTTTGSRALDQELMPLVGQQVHLAAHHFPTEVHKMPSDPSGWINITAQGHLTRGEAGVYSIMQFNGERITFDPRVFLGHHARVLVASATTVEQMREKVVLSGLQDAVQGLGQKAEQLRSLAEHLRDEGGEG